MENIEIEMHPLEEQVNVISNEASASEENTLLGTAKVNENEAEKPGLAKMIFTFLKILLLGAFVFCYDITSK